MQKSLKEKKLFKN